MATRLLTNKLIILAILGFAALVLGSIVLTFQLQIIQERNKRGLHGAKKSAKPPNAGGATVATDSKASSKELPLTTLTIRNTKPTEAYDIRLWNAFPAPEGGNFKTVGEAYWRQVLAFLRDWKDAAVYPPDPSDFHSYTTDWMVRKSAEYRASSSRSNTTNNNSQDAFYFLPRLALEKAADAGHPMAQHYLANAHASGIWPVPAMGGDDYSSETTRTQADSPVQDLHVFDEWLPTSGDHSRQIDKAYILWHMAAIGGNIESAMALAYRLDIDNLSSGSTGNTCEDVLPYYQAAADGIMDQLEVSQDSRAKIIPFMDKHTLAQVHIHGGTSSQLDWNNKPDESEEKLQFYHLKATTVPWSMKKNRNSASETDSNQGKKGKKKRLASEDEDGVDVAAAVALAQMYHHGVGGVAQNLTKSLLYYEIAGSHGDWEAAGHACIFHLWGIGTPQDTQQALEFCSIGAPFDFEGCNKLYQKAQSGGKDSSQIKKCSQVALNGMGLLHLLGIQNLLAVDLPMAEKYFALARSQGDPDACYNLAMMWLGWKTHFKALDELNDDGFTPYTSDSQSVLPIPGQKTKDVEEKYVLYKSTIGDNLYYKGPTQNDVQKAIKELGNAAKRGHLQSRHRLASIYAQGLNHTTSVIQYNFVKKDCKKAKEYYGWIINNASPTRSDRLRRAYKEYVAGNLEASVRNYLAAAEIGSIVGQVNAAFLMERGVCLGLNAADCAKASVRLWKVAAMRGNAEASLRVGDFYYYGRLHGDKLYTGPFGWIQYILLPEKYLPRLLEEWGKDLLKLAKKYLGRDKNSRKLQGSSSTCQEDEETCPVRSKSYALKRNNFDHKIEEDLHTAAHYYQIAGEKHMSARANFNLGFMHEWGLGLKQDFPMAKRYYDLALSRNYREAEIAVQIALIAMNTHEFAIRCKMMIEDWWYQRPPSSTEKSSQAASTKTSSGSSPTAGTEARSHNNKKTEKEVIMAHLFDESSFLIVVLVLLLLLVQYFMSLVGRPNRR